MKKHYYSHLIDLDSVHIALDDLDLTDKEKDHVKDLIDESLYHSILDAILSELSEEDKKAFIEHLLSEDHDKIWEFVNGKIENIEEKIKKTAEQIKDELHSDIKDTKTS